MDVCSKCGSLIAPLNMPHAAASVTQVRVGRGEARVSRATESGSGTEGHRP